jgi:V/A-type H+-transporting ATPase subunit I
MKIKPEEMTKISITGSKKHLRDVIDSLHGLELLDIDEYDGELEKGDPFEEAEDLSQLLVDIRSVLSKLPETESPRQDFSIEKLQEELPEFSRRLEEKIADREDLKRQRNEIKNRKKFFRRIRGTEALYQDLKGTETLDVFIGKLDEQKFQEEVESTGFEILEGEEAYVVFYRDDNVREALLDASKEEYTLPEVDYEGTPQTIINELDSEIRKLEQEKKSLDADLERMADNWRGRLESAEDYLSDRIERAEAPLMFGTTENTFIAKGWIPSEQYDELEEEIGNITDGKVHIQEEEQEEDENPPVKHDNNRVVEPFESLTDLVSVPRYNELDPSFMIFLTFPLFFGFMIGDAGYGLTSLAVFYAGYRVFPKAQAIFKSLMWASVATIIFGLAYGDAFGFVLFGHHSDLYAVTGIHLFEQIPILFHRVNHLGQVFEWSVLIGLAHVNLGILLGAYNEYMNHGIKAAFLEKGSWFVLEAGALLWFFQGAVVGAPVLLVGLIGLGVGEGIEGVIEIPSLISNILSYLRLFGVSVAAISLAGVVNAMANPLLQSGTIMGLTFGVALLIFGHVFNTFIKIMEGFLQGIRLHYVEMFTKFYEGGGRKYAPFGAENN